MLFRGKFQHEKLDAGGNDEIQRVAGRTIAAKGKEKYSVFFGSTIAGIKVIRSV